MKKIISLCLVLAVATVTLQAQDVREKRHEVSKDHHQGGFHDLKLSDDQKAKFKSLNDDYRQQMQDLKKQDDITVKEWKSKMQALKEDHHTKMQGLLTPDQKAQLEKAKEGRKGNRDADRKDRSERMKTRLGLTDDQSAKLKQSHSEMAEKMKAIRENKSLTDDQRKEEFKKMKEQQKESLKSILTAEQLKKLQEKKGHGHEKKPA